MKACDRLAFRSLLKPHAYPFTMRLLAVFICAGVMATAIGGCQTGRVGQSASTSASVFSGKVSNNQSTPCDRLCQPTGVGALMAVCDPPVGWRPEPLKSSANHEHQVWVSPSGRTAYGVIHFILPLPVGDELALWGFLRQMKASEGSANLLSKQRDPNLSGLRFVAEGGIYRIRAYLVVRGWEGWAVYAGTLMRQPEERGELDLALAARERTHIGQLCTQSKTAGARLTTLPAKSDRPKQGL